MCSLSDRGDLLQLGYAPGIAIQLADLPRAPSSSDSEGDGFLGLPGFPLLLVVPALAFAARRR